LKKFLFLATIAASLFYFGCSDLATNPNTNPGVSTQSAKNVTWVNLPSQASLDKRNGDFNASGFVVGNLGGYLHFNESYVGSDGNTVSIEANLTIPAGAFNGAKDIKMQATDFAAVDFFPSMIFNKPLSLNLKFTGLNLDGVNPKDINFYYMDTNGNLVPAANDGVIVDVQTGTLEVINAQIPHFSRYGFAK
jgi:hypothetical protein